MARKPMVTRTFRTLSVTVLTVDTATHETAEECFTLPRMPRRGKVLEELRAQYETSTKKIVSAISATENIVKYGMPENEFMLAAVVMDTDEENVDQQDNNGEV